MNKKIYFSDRYVILNAIKIKNKDLSDNLKANSIFGKRPEQLSVQDFIELTQLLEKDV